METEKLLASLRQRNDPVSVEAASTIEKLLSQIRFRNTIDGERCLPPNGVMVMPDGTHPLDPCKYEVTEAYANATVIISTCARCGRTDISWLRQDNTEEFDYE